MPMSSPFNGLSPKQKVCLGPFAAAFPRFGVAPVALDALGAPPSLGVRVLTCKRPKKKTGRKIMEDDRVPAEFPSNFFGDRWDRLKQLGKKWWIVQ